MKFVFSLALALFLAGNVDTSNAMDLNKVTVKITAKKDDEDVDKNTPERFKQNSDDIFMRSMYRTYSSELEVEDKKTGEKIKTGQQVVTRGSAYQCGLEVLGTHKGLKAEELTKYMETYFERAWNHYDVQQKGYIAVEMMPMLMRFLASDQLIHIYNQNNQTFAPMPVADKMPVATKSNQTKQNVTLSETKVNISTNQNKTTTFQTQKNDTSVLIKIKLNGQNATLSQNNTLT